MASTPQMSAGYEEFALKYGIPSPPKNVKEARAYMQKRGNYNQNLLQQPPFDALAKSVEVTNTEITLPEVPNHRFPVRVYKPRDYQGPALPVMLYFHGGYWCSGSADSEDFGCRAVIVRGANIIIMSFEYRLAPETPWKDVFLDAEYAMKWMANNATSLGGDASKGFIIGGSTSGAHLAAICAIRARNRYAGTIKLTGQVLIVPTTIAWPDEEGIPDSWKHRLQSHKEMAHAPVLDESLYEFYVKNLGVPADEMRKGENFPVWGPLEGLPPAYLPMDECDPIRDQGFLYAQLLAEAGVKTRTDYYRGLPNMFVQFAELSTTLTAGYHLSGGVQWLLQERK